MAGDFDISDDDQPATVGISTTGGGPLRLTYQRMPVQITSGGSGIVALCNDGTLWRLTFHYGGVFDAPGRQEWEPLMPIPQP